MYNIYIKKKTGKLDDYNPQKIVVAIGLSAERTDSPICEEDENKILSYVEKKIAMASIGSNIVPVEKMHDYVLEALHIVRPDVEYQYREYHSIMKRENKRLQEVAKEQNAVQFGLDRRNANANSQLCSVKRALKEEIAETSAYEAYFLTQKELNNTKTGFYYVHDKGSRRDTMNCCNFRVNKVLTGGFEMNNMFYNEPNSLDTAFDVIGDIVLMAAPQQYGGFTLPEIDEVLAPYAEKSYQIYLNEYDNTVAAYGTPDPELRDAYAVTKVVRDMEQGFQGWEYKFNTVASSRGDYPFVTITLGHSNVKWADRLAIACLKVRKEGQGKKGFKRPVLFPKIVFLYDKEVHEEGKALNHVFEAGIECSAKTMYPDWLSLSGDGYIASMYKQYGKIISPMGCRAFLSPWYEKGGLKPADDDVPVFEGRFNIGAISLNLPMILAESRRESRDFYEYLDEILEEIRGIHLRTYSYLAKMKGGINPLAFCEGGFYSPSGPIGLEDSIEPFLASATASFGITAFNELQRLYNGRSLFEEGRDFIIRTGLNVSSEVKKAFTDESFTEKGFEFFKDQFGFVDEVKSGFFALDVLYHINKKIEQFKNEDGRLYAIYGTPAESLCGKQVQQFRQEFGIIEGVSDREYVSNSFHCHVTEDISPIDKQDVEGLFWELSNGGKIQYVKYKLGYNIAAVRTLVIRAMEKGFYEGVNLELSYCDDCGHEEVEMDVCPCCGSRNLTKIDRMNGYLAYSRVHGDTRLNDAKMAEIAERKSM